MKNYKAIRETLRYFRSFLGARLILCLDPKIVTSRKEAGVLRDIELLSGLGLSMNLVAPAAIKTALEEQAILQNDNTHIHYTSKGDSIGAALEVAKDQQAQKLIFIIPQGGIFDDTVLVSQMTTHEAKKFLLEGKATGDIAAELETAVLACEAGISRVHFVGKEAGLLLGELFSCTGSGTMICKESYHKIRPASAADISGIIDILEENGQEFSPAELRSTLEHFYVFIIDGEVEGCFRATSDDSKLLLSHLFLCDETENDSYLRIILASVIHLARGKGCTEVRLLPDDNCPWLVIYPWFQSLGFVDQTVTTPQGKTTAWVAKV